MLMLNHLLGFGVGGLHGAADPYWDNVVFLSHFEGASSSDQKSHTITQYGSLEPDPAQFKFGSKSMPCDGIDDYIASASADYDLGAATNPWSIEYWVMPAVLGADDGHFQLASSALPGVYAPLAVFTSTLGAIALWMNGGHTYSSAGVLTEWIWHFVQVINDGTDTKLYVDGVEQVSRATASMAGAQTLVVGGAYSASYLCTAWIDEFRITKGIARTIAVPTTAFPDQ